MHFQEWWVRLQRGGAGPADRRGRHRAGEPGTRCAASDPGRRRHRAAALEPGRLDRHHPRRARVSGTPSAAPGRRSSASPRSSAAGRSGDTRTRASRPSASRRRRAAVAGLYADFLDGWLVDGGDDIPEGALDPRVALRARPLLMHDVPARRRRSPGPRWTSALGAAHPRRPPPREPAPGPGRHGARRSGRSARDPRGVGRATTWRRCWPRRSTRPVWRCADGDVLVVASKVVSKAAGLARAGAVAGRRRSRSRPCGSWRAGVRRPGRTEIVQGRSGPVMAAAGVDASNTRRGHGPASCRTTRTPPRGSCGPRCARWPTASALRLGVVVADTSGRPWRDGVADFALGAAGVIVLDDLRGQPDGHGTPSRSPCARSRTSSRRPPTWSRASWPASRLPWSAAPARSSPRTTARAPPTCAARRRSRTGSATATSRPCGPHCQAGFAGGPDAAVTARGPARGRCRRGPSGPCMLALDGLPGHVTARVSHDSAPDAMAGRGDPGARSPGRPYAMGLVVGPAARRPVVGASGRPDLAARSRVRPGSRSASSSTDPPDRCGWVRGGRWVRGAIRGPRRGRSMPASSRSRWTR